MGMTERTSDPEIVQPGGARTPALRDGTLPVELVVLPLAERPVFPGMVVPLAYQDPQVVEAVHRLAEARVPFVGLALMRDEEGPWRADNLHPVGVAARIAKAMEVAGQGLHLVVECRRRFEVERWTSDAPPVRAVVRYPDEEEGATDEFVRAYTVAAINTIKELVKHNPLHEEELRAFAARAGVDNPGRIADFAASLTSASRDELQDVLATYSIFERLKKVLALLVRELNVARVQRRIRESIEEKVSEQQRRFFLREQLRAIQKELGVLEDPREKEIAEFERRAKRLRLTDEARRAFEEDLDRLRTLEPGSPEFAVARNHLDWLTSLPWGRFVRDRTSIRRARRVLDRSHAGLADVKERILEFIAVGARRREIGGSILLFVGPPGVGKTSLGRAIAEAVGRPFFRFSVGGMRDEAEIKGHRRTYIGAMPGKIIQALKRAGAANPVIMIDEVDKIGADFRGDPASALLEVLDPEQNRDFLDHYLDVRFDLSRVLFLLTANQLDTIPAPLLDRVEILHVPGYLPEEKAAIARRHLWPRLLAAHGLGRQDVRLTDAALRALIMNYAREPGVRRLEQLLRRILRRSALALAEGRLAAPVRVGARNLEDFVGKPRYREAPVEPGVGRAVGMAWTPAGGALLAVEAIVVHRDRRGLRLTGQLGKVMQESAEIAWSFVTAHLADFGAPRDFFRDAFVHLHVPEGATPKDGPSAGITMATALLSLALGQAPARIAMTGELTLGGEVLAIGGVREKLLAARRLGYSAVIVPKANEPDVAELPASVREGLAIHFVRRFEDAARLLFPGARRPPAGRA